MIVARLLDPASKLATARHLDAETASCLLGADERARKRDALLAATERDLRAIQARVRRARRPLRGKDKIALALGAVINHYKMAKHFEINITDHDFAFERKSAAIEAEAMLDGIYVPRTDVERAFRSLKSLDLEVRPIHHRRGERVRAHGLLCMLASYLEWHMRQALKPMLFDDHDKAAAAAARAAVVAKAQRSSAAARKAAIKRTAEDRPVHSFRSLLADLGTVTRTIMALAQRPTATFVLDPKLTPAQERALQLRHVAARL